VRSVFLQPVFGAFLRLCLFGLKEKPLVQVRFKGEPFGACGISENT
jgi:hypothetical protein